MHQNSGQDTDDLTTRKIPPTLAPIVSAFELEQRAVVSLGDIEEAARAHGITTAVRKLADRLEQHGWLMPLRALGMYEFIPGARAGRYRSGDPFIELRATLRRRPNLPIMIAADSAAWLHGLATREPDRHVIAAPPKLDLPPALGDYRVIRYASPTHKAVLSDLPVWSIETLLVALAARPQFLQDWASAGDWLRTALDRANESILNEELSTHASATRVRFAYLLDRAGYPERARAFLARIKRPRGAIYFGTDRRAGVYDKEFGVVDSIRTWSSGVKP